MNKEMRFFIYLIERYAESKNADTASVMKQWDDLGITQFIYDMYELYHIESLDNAFDDIDRLIAKKQAEKAQ